MTDNSKKWVKLHIIHGKKRHKPPTVEADESYVFSRWIGSAGSMPEKTEALIVVHNTQHMIFQFLNNPHMVISWAWSPCCLDVDLIKGVSSVGGTAANASSSVTWLEVEAAVDVSLVLSAVGCVYLSVFFLLRCLSWFGSANQATARKLMAAKTAQHKKGAE